MAADGLLSTFRRGASNPAVTRLVAAVLGAALLTWAGARASRAGSAHRAALRTTEATLAGIADWRRRYVPAAAAESLVWRRTLMEVQGLGVIGDERLSLTRAVSRAAEAAGLRSVRVAVAPPDTTGSEERLSTEGVRRHAASFGLVVECRGSLQAIVNFLGELPPSVAATHLNLVRQDGRARHRLTLAVYELHFSNDTPSLWSPSERSNPRNGGSGRIGD